jgi:hypothetical protein
MYQLIWFRNISVADPDLGSGCLFDPWIRDLGWVKYQDPDPGSRMNNPNHNSKSSDRIQDKHPGSATLRFMMFLKYLYNLQQFNRILEEATTKKDTGYRP